MYGKKSCETDRKGEKNIYRPLVYYRDTVSVEDTDEDDYLHEIIAVSVDKKSKDAKYMLLLKKESIVFKIDFVKPLRSILSYTRTSKTIWDKSLVKPLRLYRRIIKIYEAY